nr:inner nuclear membrane protein src1 [Quercus suber]
MDEQEYLEPGFDPASLTVPRLRSVLVAHSVNYPSSAKKSQLIELFNQHVLSQASKMRAANARVKRSSMGIIDVGSSQDTNDDDDDEPLEPPRSVTRSVSRRSTRARTEEAEAVRPTPRSARHSTAPPEQAPRRSSSKHARTLEMAEEEMEPELASKRPASRKSRLSAATPTAVKNAAIDDDSPFSYDNVFQSGSSPPVATHRETERRRTTTTPAATRDAERWRELRRRTDDIRASRPQTTQTDGAVVPTRRTFEMPISRLQEQDFEPGENFTPEEQQELTEAQQSGELVPVRRKTKQQASHAARWGPATIMTALLAGMGSVWRQEKLQVGYCGVGAPSTELAGVEIPLWAEPIRPQCEPCPAHAFCGDRLETTCDDDFVLTQHPLSFGGIIPLAPTCEPDSQKAIKVNQVKERAVEKLRVQNAKYECGEAASPVLKESELKQTLSAGRRKDMSNEEFESLWASAIGEIQAVDEVSSGHDGISGHTLRSSSLARISFGCAVQRQLRQSLRQYLWQIISLLLLASGGAYGRYTILSSRDTEARAKQLAGLALQKLSDQASLHATEPELYHENFIAMAQLRDDVLRDEFSATRRKKLWEKVQRKVEGNANVRPMVREARTGDYGRVWEWVGAIGMLESSPASAHRRKSGRVTFGGERLTEAREDENRRPEMQVKGAVKKWEEGRGQYY